MRVLPAVDGRAGHGRVERGLIVRVAGIDDLGQQGVHGRRGGDQACVRHALGVPSEDAGAVCVVGVAGGAVEDRDAAAHVAGVDHDVQVGALRVIVDDDPRPRRVLRRAHVADSSSRWTSTTAIAPVTASARRAASDADAARSCTNGRTPDSAICRE
jgi:hypothetical protein